MSRTSWNISDRLFFTINYINDTATIRELDGIQKTLVKFTSRNRGTRF